MFFLAFVTVLSIRAVRPNSGKLPTRRVNSELSIVESCARFAKKTCVRVVRRQKGPHTESKMKTATHQEDFDKVFAVNLAVHVGFGESQIPHSA